jgi:hypothetical protein
MELTLPHPSCARIQRHRDDAVTEVTCDPPPLLLAADSEPFTPLVRLQRCRFCLSPGAHALDPLVHVSTFIAASPLDPAVHRIGHRTISPHKCFPTGAVLRWTTQPCDPHHSRFDNDPHHRGTFALCAQRSSCTTEVGSSLPLASERVPPSSASKSVFACACDEPKLISIACKHIPAASPQ